MERIHDFLIFYFFVYSFLGYLAEVFYCSLCDKRLVNRGYLYGPYLPIYGFGSLLIDILVYPFFTHPAAVFLLSLILTSSLEYFTHFALEKIFKIKLWDYREYCITVFKKKLRANINGRVCLKNSVMFGLLGLFVVYFLHSFILKIALLFPPLLLRYFSELVIIIMASDSAISTVKMLQFKKTLEKAAELKMKAEIALLKSHRKEMSENFSHLALRFPHMSAVTADLKEIVENHRENSARRRGARKEWRESIKRSIKEKYNLYLKEKEKEYDRRVLKEEMRERLRTSWEEFKEKRGII